MNGDMPSQITITEPNLQMIGLALFLNSIMIQRKMVKDTDQRKYDAELQKEIVKKEKIANDKHGRGRFMQPDILTQAAIQERQESYGQNYDLNRQN
jgi:hypothetical protein